MNRARRFARQFSWTFITLMMLWPHPALAATKNVKTLAENLEQNLCAVKTPPKPKPKTEAGCEACELQAPGKASKLTSLETKAAPIAQAITSAAEKERVARELAYFRLVAKDNETSSIASVNAKIASLKKRIEEASQKLEKITGDLESTKALKESWSAFESGSTELSPDQKAQISSLAGYSIPRIRMDLDQSKKTYENAKKNLEDYQKKASPDGFETKFFQQAVEQRERVYKEMSEALTALEEVKNWDGASDASRPSAQAFSAVQKVFNKRIDALMDSASIQKKQINNYSASVEKAMDEIKRLEAQQAKLALLSDDERDREILKEFELKYKYRGRIGDQDVPPCGLSIAEAHAISRYTGEGYKSLNSAIRGGGEEREAFKPFEDVLNLALKKLKSYQGPVKRGATLPDAVLNQHKVGQIVSYAAFTSTSLEVGFAGTHQFVIKSKTGKYLAPLSASPDEYEVLFKSDTKFKILSRKEVGEKIQFVLEEVTEK